MYKATVSARYNDVTRNCMINVKYTSISNFTLFLDLYRQSMQPPCVCYHWGINVGCMVYLNSITPSLNVNPFEISTHNGNL